MPYMDWSKLNHLQLGKYAEYYAKMEFTSYGLEVYTSEVDDHGIDFIAKTKNGGYFELQVKAVRNNNYVFINKEKWNINHIGTYLVLLIFQVGSIPDVYLIPSSRWKFPDELFCDKDYEGLKSKPEYGMNLSAKNMHLLEQYKIESALPSIAG